MANNDLGNQLSQLQEMKALLEQLPGFFEKLGSSAGSQTDSIRELAGAMNEATDTSQMQDMDSALQSLADSAAGGAAGFGGLGTAAAGIAGGMLTASSAVDAFNNSLDATMAAATGGLSAVFNIVSGGVGAVAGSWSSLVGMAEKATSAMDVVGKAMESVRGEFGDLASNEGAAVIAMNQQLRSSSGFAAKAGMSLGAVYGVDLAGALNDMKKIAGEVGVAFNRLADDFVKSAAEVLILQKGFGLTSEGLAGIASMARIAGTDTQTAMQEITVQVAHLSKQFGVSGKVIGKNLSELTKDMGSFGHMSQAELTATATYAAKLGVEIQSLKGMFDKFANFEDAATGAAKLAETFGMNVDAMELMNAESPAEQMDMMRQAFLETGRSLDDLSRQEKAYLAEQMGVDANDLYAMFDPANADLSFDEIAAEAEAANEQMSPEEAMLQAAKSIEKSLDSTLKKMETFFNAFIDGFMYALTFTEPFQKVFTDIRQAFRDVHEEGKRLANVLFGKDGIFKDEAMVFAEKLNKVLRGIVNLFKTFVDNVARLGEEDYTLEDLFGDTFQSIMDFFTGDAVADFAATLIEMFAKAFVALVEALPGMIHRVTEAILQSVAGMGQEGTGATRFGDAFSNMFEALANNIGPIIGALFQLTMAITYAIAKFLIENPKILMGAVAFLFGGPIVMAALAAIKGAIMTVLIPGIGLALKAGLKIAAKSLIKVLFGGLKTVFVTVFKLLGQMMTLSIKPFLVAFGKLVAIGLVVYGAIKSVGQIFSRLTSRFEESGSMMELVIGYLTEIAFLPARIVANIFDLIAGFLGFETDAVGAINNVVDFLINDLMGFFTGMPSLIGEAFDSVVGFFTELGQNIIDGFMATFDFVGAIGEQVTAAKDAIFSIFEISSPSKVMEKAGGSITDGLAGGISAMPERMDEMMVQMLDKMKVGMKEMISGIVGDSGEISMLIGQVFAEGFGNAVMPVIEEIIDQAQKALDNTIEEIANGIETMSSGLNAMAPIAAEAMVKKVADGLAGDGSVNVQQDGMNIQVNFKVQIDSKDLAAALGEDAEDGPFFVINTARDGGGVEGAEAAGS